MIVCFFRSWETLQQLLFNIFYLVDSHSRDMRGLSNADGTSVLWKFASLLEGDSHIKVVYLEYRDILQSCFQVQILNIDVDRSSCLNILSHYQRFCRRINHQHGSEIINKNIDKKSTKFDEAMTSKDLDIFKIKKKIFTRKIVQKYLVHQNTREQKQQKKTK